MSSAPLHGSADLSIAMARGDGGFGPTFLIEPGVIRDELRPAATGPGGPSPRKPAPVG